MKVVTLRFSENCTNVELSIYLFIKLWLNIGQSDKYWRFMALILL